MTGVGVSGTDRNLKQVRRYYVSNPSLQVGVSLIRKLRQTEHILKQYNTY